MGYFNELTFASGYYHIDAHGVVTLAPDTPPEIRERFWKATGMKVFSFIA